MGLKFNKLIAYPYKISTRDIYQTVNGDDLLVFSYSQFETKEHFLTYYFKVGLLEVCKNKALKISMVMQYSPDPIGAGSYEFKELGFESYGTTEQRNNYIGVEMSYGITLMKK